MSYQLSAVSYQQSVISSQLSAVSYQQSVISSQLSVVSCPAASLPSGLQPRMTEQNRNVLAGGPAAS